MESTREGGGCIVSSLYILLEHPSNYSNQLQTLMMKQMVGVYQQTELLQYSIATHAMWCSTYVTRTHAHTSTGT